MGMITCTDALLLNYKVYEERELPEKPGIYCIYNIINKKVYIGQSINIKVRIQQHFRPSIAHSLYFQRAIKKYKKVNFRFYILELLNNENKKVLNKLEIYYIKKFNSTNPKIGYNIAHGGGGHKGLVLSDKQKNWIARCNGKYTIGYNFITQEYVEAYSREELCKILINKGYEITATNIRDAIRHKSYTKNFLFANTSKELEELIKEFNPPIKKEVWLYDFKTGGPKLYFKSPGEAEQYIRNQGFKICQGHVYTAIIKNNMYIKDFIIASSEEILDQKIKKYFPLVYFYNIEKQFIITFPTITKATELLKSMGFTCNISSFSKAKLNQRIQVCGFIVATTKEDLIKKICDYTKQELFQVYKIIEDANLTNSQDCLNWLDAINEISVKN